MAKDKSHQIDWRGMQILADEFTGTVSGSLTGQTAVAVTWTAANPNITPDGAITIANGGTPTVAELQQFCVELNAKIAAIIVALD